jgi:hypothetical protein
MYVQWVIVKRNGVEVRRFAQYREFFSADYTATPPVGETVETTGD